MPIHTLMFGWEYPPAHCGGLGVACQGIVKGLMHHGAKVTLVLPHADGIEPGVDIISPLEEHVRNSVISIPTLLQGYDSHDTYEQRYKHLSESTFTETGIGELYGRDLGTEVERFTALAVQMTKNVSPDIVHTHDWMTIEAGVRASEHHDKPLVAHVHATELDRTEFRPNAWIYKRERLGLRKAHHVIAVSNYTKDLLVREYGIKADKISVVHNGAFHAPQRVMPNNDGKKHPLVLFLGRLTVQKGAQYFLKTAATITKTRPDVRFVIAGDGYLLPQLIEQTCAMGLEDRVIFAGKVTSAEAEKLYARADCFVMPSVSEPFGLVALEAITHGAPVVLSRQSGASEVVHNAMIVDFWDTDKMSDCIMTLLREQPMVAQMRSETPRLLKNITWKRQAAKVLSVYKNLPPQL